MNQVTIDYINSRVVSSEVKSVGDITTTYTVAFDNGQVVEGSVIRDINSFDKEEAYNAAYLEAIKSLTAGIEFVLNKKE